MFKVDDKSRTRLNIGTKFTHHHSINQDSQPKMASLDLVDMDGPSRKDLPEDGLDFGLVRSYLASLLPAGERLAVGKTWLCSCVTNADDYLILRLPVMSATRLELEMTLFSDPEFDEKISRFAQDSSIMVAYITKEIKADVFEDESEGKNEPCCRNLVNAHLSSWCRTSSAEKQPCVLPPSTANTSGYFPNFGHPFFDQEEGFDRHSFGNPGSAAFCPLVLKLLAC